MRIMEDIQTALVDHFSVIAVDILQALSVALLDKGYPAFKLSVRHRSHLFTHVTVRMFIIRLEIDIFMDAIYTKILAGFIISAQRVLLFLVKICIIKIVC